MTTSCDCWSSAARASPSKTKFITALRAAGLCMPATNRLPATSKCETRRTMTEQERMARPLAQVDPEIADLIRKETERQNSRLELIASENFTSEAILEAAGSVFTNKYAEGYPG